MAFKQACGFEIHKSNFTDVRGDAHTHHHYHHPISNATLESSTGGRSGSSRDDHAPLLHFDSTHTSDFSVRLNTDAARSQGVDIEPFRTLLLVINKILHEFSPKTSSVTISSDMLVLNLVHRLTDIHRVVTLVGQAMMIVRWASRRRFKVVDDVSRIASELLIKVQGLPAEIYNYRMGLESTSLAPCWPTVASFALHIHGGSRPSAIDSIDAIFRVMVEAKTRLERFLALMLDNSWQVIQHNLSPETWNEFRLFLGTLRDQNPAISHLILQQAIIRDHLGECIPIPLELFSSWANLNTVIKAICKGRPGSQYVEMDAYQLIQDSREITALESFKADSELEMSVVLHRVGSARDRMGVCPSCARQAGSDTKPGAWVECWGCSMKFQVAVSKPIRPAEILNRSLGLGAAGDGKRPWQHVGGNRRAAYREAISPLGGRFAGKTGQPFHAHMGIKYKQQSDDISQFHRISLRFRAKSLKPFQGHTHVIYSVAYSPDGTLIASCSWDRTIRIWDSQTGDIVMRPLEGHTDGIYSVAFSPDGSRLVSCSADRTVRVWDLKTGQEAIRPLKGQRAWAWSVSFSPDGKHIASGSADGTVRVWDAQTGQQAMKPLEGHSDEVNSVAFSPDGRLIASGSDDDTVRIWDAQTGKQTLDPLEGHSGSVRAVVFSPNSKYIASGSFDSTIRVWDAATGKQVMKPVVGHRDWVLSVAFSPDGTRIVSGSKDKTIRVWDATTGKKVMEPLGGHSLWVGSVAVSPDEERIVSGSYDKTIRVWDMKTGEQLLGPVE